MAEINLNRMLASSTSMADGGRLPTKHTAEGLNISPHIGWQRVPRNTKSIAVLMNDNDSPDKLWIHWAVFNIPSFMIELQENIPPERNLEYKMRQTVNDFGKVGYFGPMGTNGRHRYVFTVCALDTLLDMPFNPTGKDLIEAMQGHIIEKALLRTFYGNIDLRSKQSSNF
jgi:Raf kinase inhibitor-like YbhB/YbcL family protein